tara:strand:+ start:253 stop:774 length:522 start_codon:yes stop_codon:yes gene_type:complete
MDWNNRIRFYSLVSCARVWRAACNSGGSFLPLFSARLSTPLQAVGLKQYRCSSSLIGSKMSDKEHSSASLWDSPILSVQDSPREIVPAFSQRPDDASKVPSPVCAETTWDIFPDDPSGLFFLCNSAKLKGEVATLVIQSLSEPCNGEALARGTSDKNVNCSSSADESLIGHVS